MTVLFDRVRHQPWRNMFPNPDAPPAADARAFADLRRGICDLMAPAQVFVISNVAEYLYAGTDQEDWDVTTDFPTLAPPFPTFWMEYDRPSRIVSRTTGITQFAPNIKRVGILVTSQDATVDPADDFPVADAAAAERAYYASLDRCDAADFRTWIADCLATFHRDGDVTTCTPFPRPFSPHEKLAFSLSVSWLIALGGHGRAYLDALIATNRLRWNVTMIQFLETRQGIAGPCMIYRLVLGPDGNPLGNAGYGHYGVAEPGEDQTLIDALGPLFFPACLAISFLHCKNVLVHTVEPPPKLSAAYARRHGHALVRHHTLDIEPMRRVLVRDGASEQTGLKKALHICRGHFATYGGDRGLLFGKTAGTFWIPAHVKGTTRAGVVTKDYAVHTPRR